MVSLVLEAPPPGLEPGTVGLEDGRVSGCFRRLGLVGLFSSLEDLEGLGSGAGLSARNVPRMGSELPSVSLSRKQHVSGKHLFPTFTAIPRIGNMAYREDILARDSLRVLRGALPENWSAEMDAAQPGEPATDDLVVRVTAPDGHSTALTLECKPRIEPRSALGIANRASSKQVRRATLVVVPWVSKDTRAILESAGVHVLDLTGGISMNLSQPGLFIRTEGAPRDPNPPSTTVTLRGAKAGRVVRVLSELDLSEPLGVRKLAGIASVTPGYISKLLMALDGWACVDRNAAGKLTRVDLQRLLQRWAADAPLDSRATRSTWIAPRGITSVLHKLRSTTARYAATASWVAAKVAPVAPPRLLALYVDDPEELAAEVGLRRAERGVNVVLYIPQATNVYDGRTLRDGVTCAALPQVAADLLSSPARGPAEAEALLEWMSAHRGAWNG